MTPFGASSIAPSIDRLATGLTVISGVLVAIVFGAVISFCVLYREGRAADRSGAKTRSVKLETALISVMLVFGLGTFVESARVFYRLILPPVDALEVDVIAKQWMWTFHRPGEPDQINVLRVPAGRPVRLLMTSQDVIHSFYVPAFRLKQDVLPGRYTSLWFTAETPGRYEVLCAEYCGLSHSHMRAFVEVSADTETPAAPKTGVARGRALFEVKACVSCHEGDAPVGPPLDRLFGRSVDLRDGRRVLADENYFRRSILDPARDVVDGYPPAMPSFQGQLSESELADLVTYLKNKKDDR